MFDMCLVSPPQHVQQAMINSILSFVLDKSQLQVTTMQCKQCKHVYLTPSFDEQELNLLYSPERTVETKKQFRQSEKVSGRSWAEQNRITRPTGEDDLSCSSNDRPKKLYDIITSLTDVNNIKSVCDFGGRTGEMTEYFRNSQRYVYDKDLSELTDPGVKALSAFESFSNHAPYDLLVLSHVLEHVPYPSSLLRSLRSKLNENGLIYIEVPMEYCGSVIRRRGIPLGPHVNYFTQSSLLQCLKAAGYESICLSRREVASYGELQLPVYKVVASVKPLKKQAASLWPYPVEVMLDSLLTWQARNQK